MITAIAELIPEVVVIGDVEFLFLGAAGALGMPKVARRIIKRRYPDVTEDGEKVDAEDEPNDRSIQ